MNNNRQNPTVVIIGAGMTGILLVIKLLEAGISNITLLEKKETIGGTWRENTYPGIACDVPSHAYTYSFEPNPSWSSYFPNGAEIQQYFTKVFYKYSVDKYTRFNEAVTSCVYSDDSDQWSIKTSQDNTLTADLLFCATGMLHHPVIPNIPGLESFSGSKFHTAQWDHSIDLKGKRIGVVGTGSSGSQVIPQLINIEGTTVTVFQRSAQWIVRVKDRLFSETEKQQFQAEPSRMQRVRRLALFVFEHGTKALTGDSWWDRFMHKLMTINAKRTLKTSIKDPALRAKLTPDYQLGCKRVVMNDTFYDAIEKPNAHLITEGIERIETEGVVTEDGNLHPLDIIVLATGFNPTAYMRPMEFIGRGGLSIEKAWERKIQAYRSVSIPQFPNFFLMLGPHSPIGNNSVISMSEIQTNYTLQLIEQWRHGALPTIEAKPEAMQTWNQMLKSRMKHTIWTSGCKSWYLDSDGDPLAWPDRWKNWVQSMAAPDLNDFVTTHRKRLEGNAYQTSAPVAPTNKTVQAQHNKSKATESTNELQ